jgi:hypothetical protein
MERTTRNSLWAIAASIPLLVLVLILILEKMESAGAQFSSWVGLVQYLLAPALRTSMTMLFLLYAFYDVSPSWKVRVSFIAGIILFAPLVLPAYYWFQIRNKHLVLFNPTNPFERTARAFVIVSFMILTYGSIYIAGGHGAAPVYLVLLYGRANEFLLGQSLGWVGLCLSLLSLFIFFRVLAPLACLLLCASAVCFVTVSEAPSFGLLMAIPFLATSLAVARDSWRLWWPKSLTAQA